jgi:predicted MPP superfamily phosphohydrolase
VTASPGAPPTKSAEQSPRTSRRRFLKRAALGAAGLLGGGALWTLGLEPRSLAIRRVTVRLPGLPAALDGLTIGQLSDLHAGRLVSEGHIRRAAELVMSLSPDLLVLTGDYVWHGAEHAKTCARALSILKAPYGVFGVLGNHDLWTGDVVRVIGSLAGIGVKMLVNGSARLEVRGTPWWLCGMDDMWSGKPDLDAALAGVPEEAFRLLLCHEPDYADTAAARGIPLQLSGHSHGGQVRLPFLGAPILPYLGQKYPIGLQRAGDSTLVYTNVGVGVIAPPVRFNCRSEVTRLTLRVR